MSKKHMSLEDRNTISRMLSQQESFQRIAAVTGKNRTTISREIRNHMQFKKTGGYGRPFNACQLRKGYSHKSLCSHCTSHVQKFCSFCETCNSNCPDFQEEKCPKLEKPPYVCNGCQDRGRCTLEKRYYHAAYANQEYLALLSESRMGISYSEEEIRHLDKFISPLIFKGQSINHICVNNRDSLMVSESTIYRLVDYNLFQARNVDLQRKVRYSKRKKKKVFKVDKRCRIDRSYDDYLKFRNQYPDLPITQMDSVEGRKGGKVLLTIHFVNTELMLAFLRDSNASQSVIDLFDRLYLELRCDIFISLMPVFLTDYTEEKTMPKFY